MSLQAGAGMGVLTKQEEYAALVELRQRKKSGQARLKLPLAALYQLKVQRLVEPDDNGDLQINVRGLQRLRRLVRDGITRRRNWRLGK